jgi:hypothetical protein
VEYCLLTVWPVRGSFLPGDLALASPMSTHLMTHLVTSEVSSHGRCTVASTPVYEYSGSHPAPNTSRTLLDTQLLEAAGGGKPGRLPQEPLQLHGTCRHAQVLQALK